MPSIFADNHLYHPIGLGLQHLICNVLYPAWKGTTATPYPAMEYLPSVSALQTSTKNLGQPLRAFAL